MWRKRALATKRNISLDELERRKERLKRELEELHGSLDDTVVRTRDSLVSNLNPASRVRKAPLRTLGVALAVGLVVGWVRSGRKKRKKKKQEEKLLSGRNHLEMDRNMRAAAVKSGMLHYFLDEMKHLAARRAAHMLMDVVQANLKSGVHHASTESKEEPRG